MIQVFKTLQHWTFSRRILDAKKEESLKGLTYKLIIPSPSLHSVYKTISMGANTKYERFSNSFRRFEDRNWNKSRFEGEQSMSMTVGWVFQMLLQCAKIEKVRRWIGIRPDHESPRLRWELESFDWGSMSLKEHSDTTLRRYDQFFGNLSTFQTIDTFFIVVFPKSVFQKYLIYPVLHTKVLLLKAKRPSIKVVWLTGRKGAWKT